MKQYFKNTKYYNQINTFVQKNEINKQNLIQKQDFINIIHKKTFQYHDIYKFMEYPFFQNELQTYNHSIQTCYNNISTNI